MNILCLGGLCSPKLYTKCINNHIGLDNAGLALQNSLIMGFTLNECKLSTFSIPTVFSHKMWFIPEQIFSTTYAKLNISIPFINIPGIKQILTPFFSRKYIKCLPSIPDMVFVYSIQSHWLKVAQSIKNNHPQCKVVMIVTDLPEFMSDNTGFMYRLLKGFEAKLVSQYSKILDGYILLSEFMKEQLPLGNRPYMVLEGIGFSEGNFATLRKNTNRDIKVILYTGTLARRYGILRLVNAFLRIENPNYRLYICGKGDSENDIQNATIKDSRIKYLGQQSHEDIIKLQQEADLLVNPRGPEGDYTRYSFPSKTIEYFLSGTPTLLCRLPAIPKEYYDYCFVVDDTEEDTLKSKIEEILSMSNEFLLELGKSARTFIQKYKNPKCQTKRILDFVKNLN